MAKKHDFLGTGWSFPPTFERDRKGVVMVSDIEDILQSLTILLGTSLGERVMQPEYGANLKKYVFDSGNSNFIVTITDIVRTAILFHEPRIEMENLSVDQERALEGLILIKIDFVVKTTNSRFNYVYPFYINEGF